MSSTSPNGTPSLWKGLVAGLAAGVAATAAKTLAEKFYPPRIHAEPEPAALLTGRIVGRPLDHTEELAAAEGLRWGFSAAAGAAYGAVAEFYPAVTSKAGANFGGRWARIEADGSIAVTRRSVGSYDPAPAPTLSTVLAEPKARLMYAAMAGSGWRKLE